jgi:hypothetical protein
MKTVICTRPYLGWNDLQSKELEIYAAPMNAINEPRLKNGMLAYDGMGTVMDEWGANNLKEMFRIKPDIFLFWVHFGSFNLKLLRELKKISPKTLFVHGNGNQVLGLHEVCWYIHQNRSVIDVVLTSTTDEKRHQLIRKWVKKTDVLYTFGFDPSLYSEPNGISYKYDCYFGGGDSVKENKKHGKYPPWSKFRHDLMHGLMVREHSMKVRGGGWSFGKLPGLKGVDYFRDMQQAKIILGTYHDDLERRYSKRTVYGGASGRLFMTRYIPEMEKDFTNYENIVWFKTLEEAFKLVDFYLKNGDKREKIAKQQRSHFIKYHSWEARLRDFEKIVRRLVK